MRSLGAGTKPGGHRINHLIQWTKLHTLGWQRKHLCHSVAFSTFGLFIASTVSLKGFLKTFVAELEAN